MTKMTRFLLLGLLAFPALAAAEVDRAVEVAMGYRTDSLNWNIASDRTGLATPNVVSELEWKSLSIYQLQAKGHAENEYGLYTRLGADYGWIFDGKNQDSDYAGDGRTQEFSRSNNSANRGYVWDTSLGVGYHFRLAEKKWSLIPLMGISYQFQALRMGKGNQTVSVCVSATYCQTMPLGAFAGLNSTYNAEWWGPWNGVDVAYATGKWKLGASAEYHWNAEYHGAANWNLRGDLAHPTSYAQRATGSGYLIGGDVGYRLRENWTLRASGQWQDWSASRGVVTFYGANGATGEQRLNKVNWSSAAMAFSGEYRF